MSEFNGLGMHLGNLPRLSRAKTRSISAGELHRRKGQGRHGHRGNRRRRRPRPGAGLENLALDLDPGRARPSRSPTSRGPGAIQQIWMTVPPQPLATAGPPVLLGRRGEPVGRGAVRRFLLQRLGRALHRSRRCRWPSTRRRLQLLLGDALPQVGADHDREPRPTRQSIALLPDQLHPDRRARRSPPISTPSGGAATRCPTRRSTPSSTASRAGPVRRHLSGLGRQQHRLVGRRRDQVLTWTATTSSRRSAAPAPRTISAAPGTSSIRSGEYGAFSHAYPGYAAGDQAGRAVPQPAALRPVPLAHHGSDPLRAGSARHHPGARLAPSGGRYLPLQDDIASTAFWYQSEPHAPFPELPDRDGLEVI